MKKITILLLAASAFFAVNANAQRGGMQQMMRQRLVDSLHFTPAQADSTLSVDNQYRPLFRQAMMDSTDKAGKGAKIKALKDQENARLATFLSADQITQLDEMHKKMHSGMMRKNGMQSDN